MPTPLTHIQGMDIYLIDQIMKGRYTPGQKILDAGAGGGRNLRWFFDQGFDVTACDQDGERKVLVQEQFPRAAFRWASGDIAELPFEDANFDHVMCMAVLHFARDPDHMQNMWSELARVLRPGGSLLIRSCVMMGMEDLAKPTKNGRHWLPDDSERYLLTREELERLMAQNDLALLEPLKWLNVSDMRVMGTFVLEKR